MNIKLTDDLIIKVDATDLMVYKEDHVFKILEAATTGYSLYNCIEIICISSRKHYISHSPFNWTEIKY